jgi:hypothetical protein
MAEGEGGGVLIELLSNYELLTKDQASLAPTAILCFRLYQTLSKYLVFATHFLPFNNS